MQPILYGYWFGRKQLRVIETTYTSNQVPAAFNNHKIVHISDLHLSSFADSPAFLQRIIETINAQQPDLICFTGDFVGFGVGNTLPANRAYIKATEVPTTAQAQLPGRRRVCMGENAATSLDNITNGGNSIIKVVEKGQLIIIRGGVKYNVQGVRL